MSVIAIGKQPFFHFYPAHEHDVWEIVLNLSGSGMMQIGDYEYDFYPGTIICMPPNMPHSKVCETQYQDAYIQISAFAMAGGMEPLLFQDDAEGSFETLLLIANRVFYRKEHRYRPVLESLYEAMEQLLVSWHQQSQKDPLVERIENCIVNSFTDPEFSLTDMMGDSHYCVDHLRRLFKNKTGKTPQRYLSELRLNCAKKLMQKNDALHYSVVDIAMMSGFADSGYFARVFRRQTGYSPSEYIELYRQNPQPENG